MNNENDRKLLRALFFDFAIKRQQAAELARQRFAYYTSAATALKILDNGEIWMRSASVMNDASEIHYGIGCETKGRLDQGTEGLMDALRTFAIVVIACLIPEGSSACSCRATSLREQFDHASIVFVATVIESRIGEPLIGDHRPADVRVTARFRIEEQFKGDAGDVTALSSTVTLVGTKVEPSSTVNSCGRTQQFAIGSQFLVFAQEPGEVEVEACSPLECSSTRNGEYLMK